MVVLGPRCLRCRLHHSLFTTGYHVPPPRTVNTLFSLCCSQTIAFTRPTLLSPFESTLPMKRKQTLYLLLFTFFSLSFLTLQTSQVSFTHTLKTETEFQWKFLTFKWNENLKKSIIWKIPICKKIILHSNNVEKLLTQCKKKWKKKWIRCFSRICFRFFFHAYTYVNV